EMNGDKGTCTYCGTVVERQSTTGQPRFTVTQAKLEYPQPSSYTTFNRPAAPRRGPIIAVVSALLGLLVALGVGIALFLTANQSTRSAPGGPTSATTAALASSLGA